VKPTKEDAIQNIVPAMTRIGAWARGYLLMLLTIKGNDTNIGPAPTLPKGTSKVK